MQYVYFTFNGVSSSRFNLVVQNQGEDLLFPSQPGFENQIIAPIYQGATYLAGVNKKERIFNFNCWVDSLSIDLVREMLSWLSVDKVGSLVLDYNPNFQYRVKVNSISDFKHMPINGESGTANYEFTISFITIGNPSAESIATYKITSDDMILNSIGPNFDNGAPVGIYVDNQFKIFNYYSENLPLNITIETSTGFSVILNDKLYYNYNLLTGTTQKTFTVDTQYGFCKVGGALAESLNYVDTNITNIGAMRVPSGESQVFISTPLYWSSSTGILQIDNSSNLISYSAAEIAAGNLYLIVQDGSFGDSSTPGLPDEYSSVIWGDDENIVYAAALLAEADGKCSTWDEFYAIPYDNDLTVDGKGREYYIALASA